VYDPSVQLAYWQAVTDESVTKTKGGWRTTIPVDQRFDFSARGPLAHVADRRFDLLAETRKTVQVPLYELALGRNDLRVEVRERINDVWGRGDLRIIIPSPDGQERIVENWQPIFFGDIPYEQALPQLFPWANITVDEEYYEDHDKSHLSGSTRSSHALRPYQDDGEVAEWRLRLKADAVHRVHRMMESLPEDDPRRIQWFELLKDAEMSQRAEGYLRAEAERVISALGV
jgi:hypothetical protein